MEKNMQNDLDFYYFAFISYSSKDRIAAKKLQKKIETYRLPTVLRNELEAATGKKYPKNVKPLFRDMTDLNAGLLGKAILRELDNSRYLLVICTPESARSEWVNQEIENFILMGRYEKIIPYIIEGVPNSGDPATECFPPILRRNREFIDYAHLTPEENAERHAKLHAALDPVKDELKGVSVLDEGPKVSLLKVIAKMLEVAPDMLIQRDRQRQKKKNIWSSIAAILLISLLVLYVDRVYVEHVGYYADYVESWGVPRGIFPLSRKQWKHRYEHYRIYRKNGKVTRLEHVNSAGTPIPIDNIELKDRPMIAEYPLYKGKILVQRNTLDMHGKVIMSYHYSGKDIISGKDNMSKVVFKSYDSHGEEINKGLSNITSLTKSMMSSNIPLEDKRGIDSISIDRDSDGYEDRVFFMKGKDIVTDEQGIAGFEYDRYDDPDYDRITEKIYLGPDKENRERHPDKYGVVRRKYLYDDEGNMVRVEYRGIIALKENELGWAVCESQFVNGNLDTLEYLDASEKRCLTKDGYYSKVKYKYNDQGFRTEKAFFDVDDQPCRVKGGDYSKIGFEYDEQGNLIEGSYFGIDGEPCLHRDGYSKVKFRRVGNVTEEIFFGTDGSRCQTRYGVSKIALKYDRGNLIEMACFDENDKLCLNKEGIAKVTWTYDIRGYVREMAFFNEYNQLCKCKDGFAKYRMDYDEATIQYSYFGIDGTPCLNKEGCARSVAQLNGNGDIIEIDYYGVDGKLCLNENGYAKSKRQQNRNMFEEAYYDTNDILCECKDGYAKIRKEYDEQRNVTKTCYDVHGNEVLTHIVVKEITPDPDGETFGIREGDVFILYDGQPIDNEESFIEKYSDGIDKPHELVILRDKEYLVIQIYPEKFSCRIGMTRLPEDQQKLVLEKLKELKNAPASLPND